MPFMVIYNTSDGASCHEQADAIDEAALFVERLRNQDSIEDVSLYRMEEISFAFRPYYKVELGMPERLASDRPAVATPAVSTVPVADAPPAAAPVIPPSEEVRRDSPEMPVVSDAVDADGSGAHARRGLFGR